MFAWSPEQIRFLRDASEYTPFYQELAAQVRPFLPPHAQVCDAGCGLGYLSLALAPFCRRVTAADRSADALRVLRENLARTGIQNIEVLECDVFRLPDNPVFDAMLFCFFGRTLETMRCAKAHCRHKVILLKRDRQFHRFSLQNVPLEQFTFAQTCRELDALGIPFQSRTFTLEMGQPFRSLADAAAFFRLHDRSGTASTHSEADILSVLSETHSDEFPYFRSARQSVGMLVVDTGDIPDSI